MSRVVAFCSAAGGVGKTTLALASLQHLSGKKNILIDFTLHGGIEAIMRKSKRKNGLSFFMDSYSREQSIDKAIVYDDILGCDVLMNTHALQMEKISHDFVDHLIDQLKQKNYDYIIFDTSFELSERNARLFQIADQLNFVLTQDITVFWRTLKFFEILDKLMVDRKKVRMVLNKYNKHININTSEFEDEAFMKFWVVFKQQNHELLNHWNAGKRFSFKMKGKLKKQMAALWEVS